MGLETAIQTQQYIWNWGWGAYFPALFVGWIVFLAVMILFWFLIFRLRTKYWYGCYGWNPSSASGGAVAILKARLAKGEITPEEYEDLKRRIE